MDNDNIAYGIFARFYDEFTENIDYQKRGEYFDSIIKRFGGIKNGKLLDLACGTGSLSEVMSSMGYDVTGADISEDMLAEAEHKRFQTGSNILYILQDMTELALDKPVDIVICALDSLNHLAGEGEVEKAFSSVSQNLKDGGLFIFDMNSIYKHSEILGNNRFVYERDDVFFVWQNEYENGRVDIFLDFFIPLESGLYERYSEDFSEIAYSTEKMTELLEKTGFSQLAIYGDDSFEQPNEHTERLIFVAQKNNKKILRKPLTNQ